MIDYTIAAIPTEYRGRLYRSRLEARWAAFFDQLGMRHEYEPFDLGKWSPDFLLPDLGVLVEVKPITEYDPETWAKMVAACAEKQREERLLLTMVAPTPYRDGAMLAGWIGDSEFQREAPERGFLGWIPQHHEPRFTADFISANRAGWWSAGGDAGPLGHHTAPEFFLRYAQSLWANATNAVQWRPEP